MAQFSLKWPVYTAYKVGALTATAAEYKSLLGEANEGQWVSRDSKAWDYRDPFEKPGLYQSFVKEAANANGVLAFVRRHGFLQTESGPESIDQIIGWRDSIKELIVWRNRQINKSSEQQDWDLWQLWLAKNKRAVTISPTLFFEKGLAQPKLFFEPKNLLSAITLQLFMDTSNGVYADGLLSGAEQPKVGLRHCKRPGCSEWFYYGAGTGHRGTADYCSRKCNQAHSYQMTKEG